jgi:hypothetical protein
MCSTPNTGPRHGVALDRRLLFSLCLVGVTIVSLGLRLWKLDAESLDMDELVQASTYPLTPWGILVPAALQGQPPLDYGVGWGLERLGLAQSDWWVRFPAVVFGAGCVLLLGLWVERLAGGLAGITAAFLLAVCPFHVVMSQHARPYTIFCFFALAAVMAFLGARRGRRVLAWGWFGVLLFLMLMTRWTDPHFITIGIVGFAAWGWITSRKSRDEGARRSQTMRVRATVLTVVIVYVVYSPFFWLVLKHSQRSVTADASGLWMRAVEHWWAAFVATFGGYSHTMLFAPLPADGRVLSIGAALATLGIGAAVRTAIRAPSEAMTAYLLILLPSSFLYALVYAFAGNAVPKPSYLLLLSLPVLGSVAIGADALRWVISQRGRFVGSAIFVGLIAVVAIPMGRVSARSVSTVDKWDWRGVMNHLRDHASADDAIAVIATDTVPPVFHVASYGRERYGAGVAKFVNVRLATDAAEIANGAWRRVDNTVWIIAFKDRMYRGYDQVPAPIVERGDLRVHDFRGLFLMESTGRAPAGERFVEVISGVYSELPVGRSLVAPAMLAARLAADRGLRGEALDWFAVALAQCDGPDQRAILTRDWVVPLQAKLEATLGVEHHTRAEESGNAAEPLPGGEGFVEQVVRRRVADERLQEDHTRGE